MRARPLGLARSSRLRSSLEIRGVQDRGRRRAAGPLVVVVLSRDAPTARLALAVSRKVGDAVRRNHVKRRVREAFRHLRPALRPVDVVVIARPGAASADGASLARWLREALTWLGTLPGDAPRTTG